MKEYKWSVLDHESDEENPELKMFDNANDALMYAASVAYAGAHSINNDTRFMGPGRDMGHVEIEACEKGGEPFVAFVVQVMCTDARMQSELPW